MIKITIADVKSDWKHLPEEIADCEIYLIRDSDGKILYIGRSSVSVLDRIQSHLGDDWRSQPSRLGRYILSKEGSDDWTVELFTPEECKPQVDQFYSCRVKRFDSAAIAERAMIGVLKPLLNYQR
jgi:hypothetical protein